MNAKLIKELSNNCKKYLLDKCCELASVKKFQTGDQPTITKPQNTKTEKSDIPPQQSVKFKP